MRPWHGKSFPGNVTSGIALPPTQGERNVPPSGSGIETTRHDAPPTHSFLLMAAELLHRYGTPSYRLEGVMEKVAGSLNVSSVFLYTPTALVVELADNAGQATYVRRVESG